MYVRTCICNVYVSLYIIHRPTVTDTLKNLSDVLKRQGKNDAATVLAQFATTSRKVRDLLALLTFFNLRVLPLVEAVVTVYCSYLATPS